MKRAEAIIEAEIKALVNRGQANEALQMIRQNKDRLTSDSSEHLSHTIQLIEQVCQLHVNGSHHLEETVDLNIPELIICSVRLGLLDVADTLTNHSNIYDLRLLIGTLYHEGYISLAKDKLIQLDYDLLTSAKPPYRDLAYIYAEILHDEGQYNQAAEIFESLAQQTPYMAKARYAACSCYLQEAMNFLWRRIELYHPAGAELERIDKFIDDLAIALNIVHSSNWHTVWSFDEQTQADKNNKPPLAMSQDGSEWLH